MEAGLFSGGMEQLRRNYRVTALGTDEVIGRPAYLVLLEPNGPGVSRELWVDQATGTVLRTEERDASRGVVLTTYFSRISFSLNLPAAYFQFQAPAGARVFPMFTLSGESTSSDALRRQAGLDCARAARAAGRLRVYRGRGQPVRRPDVGVSPVQRRREPVLAVRGARRLDRPDAGQTIQVGAASGRLVDLGYLRVLTWEQGGLHLTAVGTMPTDTLIAIAGHLVGDQEQALVQSVAQTVRGRSGDRERAAAGGPDVSGDRARRDALAGRRHGRADGRPVSRGRDPRRPSWPASWI